MRLPDETHAKVNAHPGVEGKGTQSVAHALRRWLVSGRCQAENGAFYAWFDATNNEPAFEYPEITGYALTHLAGLANQRPEEMAAGHRAARWLVGRIRRGDFSARAQWDGSATYNFDLAMIATGLMAFGVRAEVEEYTSHGLRLVRYLHDQIQNQGHLSSLNRSDLIASNRFEWSTHGLAHLLKVVQCFLFADSLGASGAISAAAMLIDQIAPLQTENGRFVTQPGDEMTMLHPHLYAVEGLWMWGTAQRDAAALARARKAVEWGWVQQLDSGGFPRFASNTSHDAERIEQFDVTCQMVRMALALMPESNGLQRAITRISEIALADQGGLALPYQPTSSDVHLNTWVTLFGRQAMAMAEGGSYVLTWRCLI